MWSSKPENQKQPATKVSLTAVDSKAVSRTETEQNPNGYGDVTSKRTYIPYCNLQTNFHWSCIKQYHFIN